MSQEITVSCLCSAENPTGYGQDHVHYDCNQQFGFCKREEPDRVLLRGLFARGIGVSLEEQVFYHLALHAQGLFTAAACLERRDEPVWSAGLPGGDSAARWAEREGSGCNGLFTRACVSNADRPRRVTKRGVLRAYEYPASTEGSRGEFDRWFPHGMGGR